MLAGAGTSASFGKGAGDTASGCGRVNRQGRRASTLRKAGEKDRGRGAARCRSRHVQSQLERRRIDRREQITLFYRLVVDDAYADNPAADVRRDVDEVGGDIGVVGVRASIDNAIIVSCSAISG